MTHPIASAAGGKPKTKAKGTSKKPQKPYPEFPLFAHATGRWAKKIRGKTHYFGSWNDPDAALTKYLDEKDDLHAGRTPRPKADGLTLRELANRFLTSKQTLLDAKEITQRTWNEYHAACARVIEQFGKTRLVIDLAAEDFEQLRKCLASTLGPVALGNEIQRVRTLFKYAYDAALIDRPVRFGPAFKKPSKKVMRKARNDRGPRMFEATDIRAMLDIAPAQLKAMILLGVNCGYGNADCGTLPQSAVDLDRGWLNYPRPKTGVQRRCPLWPETVKALQVTLAVRPEPKANAAMGLMFVTRCGAPWAKEDRDNPIAKETAKLLKELGIARPGLNFYALRHTFETIGGESRDQVAVDAIMGHERPDMASVYRERISDERLKAVTDHVHAWLSPPKKATNAKKKRGRS